MKVGAKHPGAVSYFRRAGQAGEPCSILTATLPSSGIILRGQLHLSFLTGLWQGCWSAHIVQHYNSCQPGVAMCTNFPLPTFAGEDLAGDADQQALLRRLHAFARDAMAPQATGAPPMQALVRRLQEALASTEAFPVQYSAVGPSHAASSALRAFGGAGSGANMRPRALLDTLPSCY